MNRIEAIKAAKNGLDVGDDIYRYAKVGMDAIPKEDLERLKWYGIFHRKATPGYFMMRIRIPNGILNANQLRTIGEIADEHCRGRGDLTTRQQIQIRWLRIENIPVVALPLASRWYPSEQQGLAMGIAGSGNSGTVLTALFAPRLAQLVGWQSVFGLALIPLALVCLAFWLLAKDAPNHPPRKSVTATFAGDWVYLVSRRGKARSRVRVTDGIHVGLLFMPFHWDDLFHPETNVNYATNSAFDPISKQPELKCCAVRMDAPFQR